MALYLVIREGVEWLSYPPPPLSQKFTHRVTKSWYIFVMEKPIREFRKFSNNGLQIFARKCITHKLHECQIKAWACCSHLRDLVLHFLFYSYLACSYNQYIIQHAHCISQSAYVQWYIVLHCLGVTMMGLFHWVNCCCDCVQKELWVSTVPFLKVLPGMCKHHSPSATHLAVE